MRVTQGSSISFSGEFVKPGYKKIRRIIKNRRLTKNINNEIQQLGKIIKNPSVQGTYELSFVTEKKGANRLFIDIAKQGEVIFHQPLAFAQSMLKYFASHSFIPTKF